VANRSKPDYKQERSFFPLSMNPLLRQLAIGAVLILAAAYCVAALRGPQGIEALLEKHRQIRAMQEENAAIVRENESLRKRNLELGNSQAAQERAIREKLGRVRKGEQSFVLPDEKKTGAVAPNGSPAPK
jgi:cell division protein FtsB